jgi:hypothetical protein
MYRQLASGRGFGKSLCPLHHGAAATASAELKLRHEAVVVDNRSSLINCRVIFTILLR